MKKTLPTVIEITDTHIKLLQTKLVRQQHILTRCDIRALPSPTDQDIIKILSSVTFGKGVRSEHFSVVIPRRFTIIKQLQLPSTNQAELRKMISLQLASLIPYSLADVIYDYDVLEQTTEGYSQVLVTVVAKDVVQRYLKIFDTIGMHPGKFVVSSSGILEWSLYYMQQRKIEEPPATTIAYINIDSHHSEICFCRGRSLYFSRHVNYGAKDLGTDNMLGLFHQIELSIHTFQKEHLGPEIKKVTILSSMAQAKDLAHRVESQLKIAADVVSPSDMILSKKNLSLNMLKEDPGLSLTVPVGMLYADPKRLVSLMPQEVHETKKTKLKQREFAQTVVLSLLIFAIGISGTLMTWFQKLSVLNEVEKEYDLMKSRAASAKEQVRFVEAVQGEFGERVFIADYLDELVRITPDDISFRSIQYTGDDALTIQGYAQTSGSVNSFQALLLKSVGFKDVNLVFATQRRIFNKEVTDFKITCQLKDLKG